MHRGQCLNDNVEKTRQKLETIAIVPQMLITPEMLLTDKLCLGRNRGVGLRRDRHWGPGTKARDSVLRHIKILDR